MGEQQLRNDGWHSVAERGNAIRDLKPWTLPVLWVGSVVVFTVSISRPVNHVLMSLGGAHPWLMRLVGVIVLLLIVAPLLVTVIWLVEHIRLGKSHDPSTVADWIGRWHAVLPIVVWPVCLLSARGVLAVGPRGWIVPKLFMAFALVPISPFAISWVWITRRERRSTRLAGQISLLGLLAGLLTMLLWAWQSM